MLDESVKRKIAECYQRMNGEGKLHSQQKLAQYYATFRSRFGPEQLANLDGQALLDRMYGQASKDGLMYWLEFKNDDEFPSPDLGSIAGGSSLKFGIFRRKETGAWATAGEDNYPKEIPVEEAVGFARRYRDELLKGVEIISRVPSNGSDEDYQRLQKQLDEAAPGVSDLAWGHKYFSLLFPEKLDDYHVPDLQRFHLLKTLQIPPEGDGRYLCAGRFVAAAAELGVPLNSLTSLLNALYGRRHRYWRVGTSDGKAPRNRWDLMKNGNCVAIGWAGVGDLSWVEYRQESKDRLRPLVEEKYPSTPSAIGRARNQIFNFVTVVAEGDYVLAADGGTVIGVGRVTGDYSYEPTSDFPHHRPVEWLSLDEWKMPQPEGLQTTVHEIKAYPQNILEAERRVQNSSSSVAVLVTSTGGSVPRLSGIPGRIQSVLERKSQVILYGPPGTGKTFWAEKSACEMAAYATFGKPFDQLTEQEKQGILGTGQSSGTVRICCFHPAYGYEDFIEGYRPETHGGQMTFVLRDGVFKHICREAEAAPDRRFYLVVDEINRGDIPRIFGELLTVLEKDKRGKSIVLPISREIFRVPANVLVIGTMNTADRSISLLDAALRRRFGFVELMPDTSLFRDHVVSGIPLGPWLDALNRRICEHVGRDARNLQIGHSYLLQAGRPVKDVLALKRAIRDDILPLIEEYCYEDFTALQSILGNGLFDVESQRIRHELFDDGQEHLLADALKEPCPEILTTAEAISSEGAAVEGATESDEPDQGSDE